MRLVRRPHTPWLRERHLVISLEGGGIGAIAPAIVRLEDAEIVMPRDAGSPVSTLIEQLKVHAQNYAITHPGKTMPSRVLVAIDRSARWSLVSQVLQSLAAWRDPYEVGLLFAVDDPVPRPSTVAMSKVDDLVQKAGQEGAPTLAGHRLYQETIVQPCASVQRTIKRTQALDPTPRYRAVLSALPADLRACRCAAEPDRVQAVLYKLHHRPLSGVVWRTISKSGSVITLPRLARWEASHSYPLKAVSKIWPVAR